MSERKQALYWCRLLILGLFISCSSGCFSQDPETTVTVIVSGLTSDDDRDKVNESLKGMADGSSHFIKSSWSGSTTTFKLSPVKDVEAFSKKVNFGKVIEVKDRTVKVAFGN